MEKTTRANAPLSRQPRYGWRHGTIPERVLGKAVGSGAGGRPAQPAQYTSLGMEGTVLFQKTIDNSSVNYRHDPRDRDALRWHVSWGLFVVLMVLLASGPRLWVRHSGYRQAQLTEKIEELIVVRDQLKVQKGRLEDLRRVAAFAEQSGLQETDEDRYTWFAPSHVEEDPETAVARLFVRED